MMMSTVWTFSTFTYCHNVNVHAFCNVLYFFVESDEDLACMKGPSSKKSRVLVKEPQRDKSLHQSSKSFGQDSKNTLSLDDEENEVDSQASSSLSVLQRAVVVEKAPSRINLHEVTSERGSNVNPSSQRRAAVKAKDQQRSILKVERISQVESGQEDKDYKPTCIPQSCSPTPATSKPVLTQRKLADTPTLPGRPSPISPVGGRLLKWNPPAQSGISPSSTPNSTTKSPGQGLRLGLSRLARVKPLHPTASGN
uniref:RAD51-associated protein 1-like n=1 Tax=Salmo trutta TaxID=8032 RepID=A0A673W380_SALTR